jgi:hypothetical protein
VTICTPAKAQMLEQGRDVGLIARDPVQCFGEHNVELAMLGILQQGLDTRSEDDAGARDGGILIGIDDLPTLLARMLTTDAQLVLDGHHALIVRRVAGVKRNLWHGLVSRLGLTSIQPFTPISRHKLIERPPDAVAADVSGELDRYLFEQVTQDEDVAGRGMPNPDSGGRFGEAYRRRGSLSLAAAGGLP